MVFTDAWLSKYTFIIQSVSEFCDNSPVAEKAVSCSIDLGLIVIKVWNSFQGYLTSSLWPQKDSFPFS